MRFISPSEKAALEFGKLWRTAEKKTVFNYGGAGKNDGPWDDLDTLMGQKEPAQQVGNGATARLDGGVLLQRSYVDSVANQTM